MKKVIVELENWDYECGDRCCYDSGTKISINGVLSENDYLGDDIKVLEFAFKVLGIEYELVLNENDNI